MALLFIFVSCSKAIVTHIYIDKEDTIPKFELNDWETVKDSINITEDEKQLQ